MPPDQIITKIKSEILTPIIALLFALALVVFLYGVYESLRDSSSDEGRTKGKEHMIWGLIGMTIMVSAIGLVNLICDTIGCAA
jgi:uncharacterized membrane protein